MDDVWEKVVWLICIEATVPPTPINTIHHSLIIPLYQLIYTLKSSTMHRYYAEAGQISSC